jgi:hypothetical protein
VRHRDDDANPDRIDLGVAGAKRRRSRACTSSGCRAATKEPRPAHPESIDAIDVASAKCIRFSRSRSDGDVSSAFCGGPHGLACAGHDDGERGRVDLEPEGADEAASNGASNGSTKSVIERSTSAASSGTGPACAQALRAGHDLSEALDRLTNQRHAPCSFASMTKVIAGFTTGSSGSPDQALPRQDDIRPARRRYAGCSCGIPSHTHAQLHGHQTEL